MSSGKAWELHTNNNDNNNNRLEDWEEPGDLWKKAWSLCAKLRNLCEKLWRYGAVAEALSNVDKALYLQAL